MQRPGGKESLACWKKGEKVVWLHSSEQEGGQQMKAERKRMLPATVRAHRLYYKSL